jgi:hypothetical protein
MFSNTPSLCSSHVRDQVSAHAELQATLWSCIFWFLRFSTADEKTEGSGLNGSRHYQNSISS